MKSIILSALLLTTSLPASASSNEAADTMFHITSVKYAQMKIIALNCDFPVGDYVSVKARVIEALAHFPGIDLIAADRMMERQYESELIAIGSECTQSAKDLYKSDFDSIDGEINSLREAIGEP